MHMRTRRWPAAALAAGVGLALTLVPTSASAAPTTLTIRVGGDSTIGKVVFEGMRFFAPRTIAVHKGDTLKFVFDGFHTATLLPAGVGADDWRADNNTGRSQAYSLIKRDSDDSNVVYEFNKAVLFPSNPTCGATSSPCTYDGTSLVNSGAPLGSNSFAVTINANPGSTFWVLCLIHAMMQTRVRVVSDTTATTTQAQIDSYRSSTLASDREQAQSLIPKLQRQSRHKTANGVTVWDAYAGYDGPGWSLDGMFPTTLHIRKGQWVRWHFGQVSMNVHTVTFPRSAAASLANNDFSGQNVKCETSNGDAKADAPPPTFCSSGGVANVEFEVRASGVLTRGSKSYAGSGLHSSGVRGGETGSFAPYDLKFTKVSGKSGFGYACAVHGTMMSGAVVVKR